MPDKAWTAWPLRWEGVPPTGFMNRGDDDEDGEGRTFRRKERREGFGVELEEEVSAMMLRLAKEKFMQRKLGDEEESKGDQVLAGVEKGDEDSDISLSQIKGERHSGVEDAKEEEGQQDTDTDATSEARRKRQRTESPGLLPTVSTDDDLSYELLRPVTRHLLSKLDKTFTVLHNARVAGIDYVSGSDEEQEEELRKPRSPHNRQKRKIWRGEASPPPEKPNSRRLDLHTPLEGETEREMQVRLARKYHRRIPRLLDEEGETSAAETAGSRRSRRQKRLRVSTRSMSRASPEKPNTDTHRGNRLNDWALRDWSDVLGAAAIAGFSPGVIARATQRCADLFGQGMEFNTIAEEPATGRAKRSRTTRYVPGGGVLPTDDEAEDEEEAYLSEAEQIRAVSRASSVIMHGSSDEEDDSADTRGAGPRRARSMSSLNKRGYSVGPSVVRLYCPNPTCSGAINGFTRRSNLKRHLNIVHGKNAEVMSEDDDDMDEVHGAVHVDGFLKPIKPRRGWRAGDTQPSIRRKSRRKTRAGTPPPRQFYSDDGYYAELSDDALIKQEDDQEYT